MEIIDDTKGWEGTQSGGSVRERFAIGPSSCKSLVNTGVLVVNIVKSITLDFKTLPRE